MSFDPFVNALFKRDSQGQTVFFGLGAGRIINMQQQVALQRFLRKYYALFLSVGSISAILGVRYTLLLPLGVMIVAIAVYYFTVGKMLRDAPISREKPPDAVRDRFVQYAASEKWSSLWQAELFTLGFTLLGVWWIASAKNGLLWPIISVVFFSLASLLFAYMIVVKLRHK